MKPVKFEQANFDWGAPQGQEENVGSMPAYKGTEGGTNWPVSISCWELSQEEMEEVKRTGKVWLRVYGPQRHPVVSIGTSDPWS